MMPRQKRLEVAGAVYHVVARGIERRVVFVDDHDREEFVSRLEKALGETGCRCYAWALLPNHFHLVLSPAERALSDTMRRVLSGYAQYFNRRHKRSGHLFQNRYKSILCDADDYLLELVRYVHLNPLRAKLVSGMDGLKEYRWCGHGALVGTFACRWQEIDNVLEFFGQRRRAAGARYVEYVADGIAMGRRNDLTGGGLRRSAGGWKRAGGSGDRKTRWASDERILGDSAFVIEVLKHEEKSLVEKERTRQAGWDIERLIRYVCSVVGVKSEVLQRKGRGNALTEAKALIAHSAKHDLGMSGAEIGARLGITRQAVSVLVRMGAEYRKARDVKLTS